MAEENISERVFTQLGRLAGLMEGLSRQFDGTQREMRGGLADAHKRMDKMEENSTARMNEHAKDIKELRGTIDTAKGGVIAGKLLVPAFWAMFIALVSLTGWLLLSSPIFAPTPEAYHVIPPKENSSAAY